MQTTDRPTKPCPSDQAQSIRRPTGLAELAISQGIDPCLVAAFLDSQSVPSFKIVATVIGLQAVEVVR